MSPEQKRLKDHMKSVDKINARRRAACQAGEDPNASHDVVSEWSPEGIAAAVTLFVVAAILLWYYARQLPINQ